MDLEQTIVDKYRLEKRIGNGAFGDIYLARHLTTKQKFACKVEKVSEKHPQLKYEERVYHYLKGGKGIPTVYFYGEGDLLKTYSAFVINKFSLKTVLMLGDQMLQRIEFVHINNFLHRDIKPDNFLMGNGKNSHILYIIDFGLAKRFVDPKTGEHIPYRDGKSLTGTARYASLNTHIGQEQARRDDIESIAFVMIYFLKGCLPWQGVSGDTKEEKYQKIKEKKIDTPITDLSKNLPSQFLKFFELVRNIGFEDTPDYVALRTLLAEMFTNKNFQNDFQYDWVIKANKMSKGRYHSLTNDNRKTKEFYQGKHHYKGRNESSGKLKGSKFKNQNYKKEFNQKAWNGKGGREHKTQENFPPKHNHYKEKNHDYENKKERGDQPYVQNQAKNHYKNTKPKPPLKTTEESKELERGEEYKKPVISDQRKKEHKALFANQLMSINKTLRQGDDKKPPSRPLGGMASDPKVEHKSTALAGRDFVHSKGDTAFKEKPTRHHESKKQIEEVTKPYGRGKRGKPGFKVHAEAMFNQQNGSKGTFTDFN